MKLDILVIAAHPDDAELGCGGTIVSEVEKGRKVGVVDLTRGELGTRGSADLRMKEADEAKKILGLSIRENLGFEDGFFENDRHHNLELIKIIRQYKPEVVLANAVEDRHSDHGKGAELAYRACFLSGLSKIETSYKGINQEAWRPKVVYNYIQDKYIAPDFVVDISDYWSIKREAILAFRSQFNNSDSLEPQTYISSPEFFSFVEARAKEFGHSIGVMYGEGFTKQKQIGVKSLLDIF